MDRVLSTVPFVLFCFEGLLLFHAFAYLFFRIQRESSGHSTQIRRNINGNIKWNWDIVRVSVSHRRREFNQK